MYKELAEYLKCIALLPRDEYEKLARKYAEKIMVGCTDMQICRALSGFRK